MKPNTGTGIADRSVGLLLRFSRFGSRRSISSDQVEVEADKSLIHVSKDILDSRELQAISRFDLYTRVWVMTRALPSELYKAGAYLIPVDVLEEVYQYLTTRMKAREQLIEQFIEAYPALKKAAKERLKDLFDPRDYPAEAEMGSAFTMSFQVIEHTSPGSKLRAISKMMFEREREKYEEMWANAGAQIKDALRESMADLVGHLVERLSGDNDGKPKRIHETRVKAVEEFLDSFGKRNIVDDTELAALVEQAKKIISGVDVKQLREDDKLRARVVIGFSEVKAALDTMLIDRPGRLVTVDKDEEV